MRHVQVIEQGLSPFSVVAISRLTLLMFHSLRCRTLMHKITVPVGGKDKPHVTAQSSRSGKRQYTRTAVYLLGKPHSRCSVRSYCLLDKRLIILDSVA